MTRSALALRHLAFEDAGSLAQSLEAAGYALSYLDVWREPVPADLDPGLLIVLGGPIDVADGDEFPFLADEIALLKRRLSARRPTLGICLGAQLMAAALDQKVYPGKAPEVGWGPVTLTDAGRSGPLAALDGVAVLHWHGNTFDIPPGAELLASTDVVPHQAFALGPNILALQFHPEARADDLEAWYIGHIGELRALGIQPSRFRAESERIGAALETAAKSMFAAWLAGLA